MPYVVRDHRAVGRWTVGLLASVLLVVVVCAVTDRWWVAAIGLPLSCGWAALRMRRETSPLLVDDRGITLDGRWTDWQDVAEVAVLGRLVQVTLRETAPLPSWARGRVTGAGAGAGAGADRLQLTSRVPERSQAVHAGIRREAPASVAVTLQPSMR